MKRAFRYLLPLLLLMLLTLPALAEKYEFADDLTGEYLYPAGSDESTATYIYRYRYPQLSGDDEIAAMFNTTYAYTADDTLAFEAPMNAGLTDGAAQATIIDVTYEVTCQTADYLSILITKHTKRPDSESTTISGHVFALTGSRAGEIISLPYLLGILTQDGKVDTWLQDRQTAKADNCVRELVWAEIERMMKSGGVPFYDGLTFEELEAAFYPEEDFYLDENGDPDFSHRQELPQEPIDATRQVYIAWNQLVTNENLSAEERYAYRRDVFTNLPDMDWQEFGALGGIDSSGTIFALLDWLSQQEHYSSGDIYFIQRGYAARGIDGAYAEDYCYLLSRALFSDPVAYAKALARSTADDEAVQTLIMGGTAYGADYYPADCETAVSALDAAINANALTAEETGWAKLLRYYLVNPNSGYYADYPKTPAELEN